MVAGLRSTNESQLMTIGFWEDCRSALETATITYLSAHYHDGVAAVFATPGNAKRFVIQIVANKYNPTNFWCVHLQADHFINTTLNIAFFLILGLDDGAHSTLLISNHKRLQARSLSTCIITNKAT
jgi:hypothetical protein